MLRRFLLSTEFYRLHDYLIETTLAAVVLKSSRGNEGGSAQVISTLIQARADVNDKFHTINGLWRFIIFTQSLRHKFSRLRLT